MILMFDPTNFILIKIFMLYHIATNLTTSKLFNIEVNKMQFVHYYLLQPTIITIIFKHLLVANIIDY